MQRVLCAATFRSVRGCVSARLVSAHGDAFCSASSQTNTETNKHTQTKNEDNSGCGLK